MIERLQKAGKLEQAAPVRHQYQDEGIAAHEELCEAVGRLNRGVDIDAVVYTLEHAELADTLRQVNDCLNQGWTLIGTEIEGDASAFLGFEPGTVGPGSADLVLKRPGELMIRDLKWGIGTYVPAENNYQLVLYALQNYGAEQKIHLCIDQPRHFDDPGTRTWTIDARQLKLHADMIRSQVQAITRLPRYQAGAHCKYCQAALGCSHREKTMYQDIEQLKAAVKTLDEGQPLQGQRLADLLFLAPQVESFLKQVREKATEMARAGAYIPGWRLNPGRATQKWKEDEETVVKKIAGWKGPDGKTYGLDTAAPRKPLSPAQAKALVKDNARRVKALEDMITVSTGAPHLVVDDSPGQSYTESVQEHFKPQDPSPKSEVPEVSFL